MAISRFFSKKKRLPTLVKCTHCDYEFHLSPTEVRLLHTQNAGVLSALLKNYVIFAILAL